jgi:TRAP-type C4-dicarboxylate transport system permease small subunit
VSLGEQSGEKPRVLAAIHRFEDILLALVLGTIVILAPLQILMRNFFDSGWVWADPFLRVLVLWVALLGALAASRQDKQIAIDVVSKFLAPRPKAIVGFLTGLLTAFVCGVIAYHSGIFVAGEREFGSKAFGNVPAWLCQIVIPVAFALIGIRHASRASTHARVVLGLLPLPEDDSVGSSEENDVEAT